MKTTQARLKAITTERPMAPMRRNMLMATWCDSAHSSQNVKNLREAGTQGKSIHNLR